MYSIVYFAIVVTLLHLAMATKHCLVGGNVVLFQKSTGWSVPLEKAERHQNGNVPRGISTTRLVKYQDTIRIQPSLRMLADARRQGVQQTGSDPPSWSAPRRLDSAAENFLAGARSGKDEDDLIAQELGLESASDMGSTQEEYKDKIKEKLSARAKEIEEERRKKTAALELGKLLYERGRYSECAETLEKALEHESQMSPLGGEIQMWLALAYQACGREQECIAVYKNLEANHPVPAIRRQAGDLRYIMEAPKLELGEDEKVKLPVLSDIDSNSKSNKLNRPRRSRGQTQQKNKKKKAWDEEFWESYKPPQYLKNRYVWAAGSIIAVGLAWYSSTTTTR